MAPGVDWSEGSLNNKIQRNSALELLRILAMLFIMATHFSVHGIYHVLTPDAMPAAVADNMSSWQMHITNIMAWWGDFGNSIFIAISGYFMVDRQVKPRKIVLLASNTFLYAWVILALVKAFAPELCPEGAIAWNLVPMWVGENWFVSCYILFFCFVPFYNKFLMGLRQREYLRFVLLFFMAYTALPAMGYQNFMAGAKLLLFGMMYAIGGYLRRFCQERLVPACHRGYARTAWGLLCLTVLLAALTECNDIYFHVDDMMKKMVGYVFALQVVLVAMLLMAFGSMKPFYSRGINSLAGATLGVYLIHDNAFMRTIIWDRILPNAEYFTSDYYVLFVAAKIAGVFLVCSGIELIRQRYVEPWQERLIDRVYPPVSRGVQGLWEKFARTLGA